MLAYYHGWVVFTAGSVRACVDGWIETPREQG